MEENKESFLRKFDVQIACQNAIDRKRDFSKHLESSDDDSEDNRKPLLNKQSNVDWDPDEKKAFMNCKIFSRPKNYFTGEYKPLPEQFYHLYIIKTDPFGNIISKNHEPDLDK